MPRRAGAVLLAALVFAASSCATADGGAKTAPLTARGTVRVVGNEPFTRVVITRMREGAGGTAAQEDIVLSGDLARRIGAAHQGEEIVVTGTPCPKPPPGFTRCIVPTRFGPAPRR